MKALIPIEAISSEDTARKVMTGVDMASDMVEDTAAGANGD
jgi:hypothetical protein